MVTPQGNGDVQYEFSLDTSNPSRVARIELEFVGFTLKLTLQNGETHVMTDPDKIQELLNRAHDFNALHFTGKIPLDPSDTKHTFSTGNHGALVEIKLDPVNSVNTFHIPL